METIVTTDNTAVAVQYGPVKVLTGVSPPPTACSAGTTTSLNVALTAAAMQATNTTSRNRGRAARRISRRPYMANACIAAAVSATFKLVIVPAEQTVGG